MIDMRILSSYLSLTVDVPKHHSTNQLFYMNDCSEKVLKYKTISRYCRESIIQNLVNKLSKADIDTNHTLGFDNLLFNNGIIQYTSITLGMLSLVSIKDFNNLEKTFSYKLASDFYAYLEKVLIASVCITLNDDKIDRLMSKLPEFNLSIDHENYKIKFTSPSTYLNNRCSFDFVTVMLREAVSQFLDVRKDLYLSDINIIDLVSLNTNYANTVIHRFINAIKSTHESEIDTLIKYKDTVDIANIINKICNDTRYEITYHKRFDVQETREFCGAFEDELNVI